MNRKGYRIVKTSLSGRKRTPIHQAVRRLWNTRDREMQTDEYYALVETEMTKLGYHVVSSNDYTDEHWPDVHLWLKDHIGVDHYTWSGHLFYFETQDAAFQFRMFCQ